MTFFANTNTARKKLTRRVASMLLAILWLVVAIRASYAEARDIDWRIDPELYLTGMSNFRRTQNDSAHFNTAALTAELTISHAARPYYGGLFADYRASNTASVSSSINVGGYFRYNFANWDATSWLFASKSGGAAESWIYAGRLRYRLAANHKIGIEATSLLARLDSPVFAVGYYGSLSDSLSLNSLRLTDSPSGLNPG